MEPEKTPSGPIKSTANPIRSFAIKTVIITVAILVVVSYVDNIIDQRIEQIHTSIGSATKIGGRDFWTKLELELENQADPKSDISPEKKRKIIAEIRTISDRWRPFVSEIRSAVVGDGEASAK